MEKQLLKKLKRLPKGSRKLLAQEFGVSLGHIYNILSGQKENDYVVLRAVEMLGQFIEKKREAEKFLDGIN
jgi:hypothetical protein